MLKNISVFTYLDKTILETKTHHELLEIRQSLENLQKKLSLKIQEIQKKL